MSTLSWSKGQAETQALGNYVYFNAAPSPQKAGNANFISSSYRAVDTNRSNLYNGWMGVYNKNTSGYGRFAVRNDAYADSTGTEFATAMSGQTIVYELATPLTYPLSAQQLDTLTGQNVMWADAGEVDVEYVADNGEEGGKLALLLRNRPELLIAMRKGAPTSELMLAMSSRGDARPGIAPLKPVEEKKDEDEEARR